MIRLRGFTFVELMLAASIFAVVAVAVYATFSSGISAWRKTEEMQDIYQDVRLALDKMAQDLENAVLYSEGENSSNFQGETQQVSFYTLQNNFHKAPVHPELRRITYMFEELEQTLKRIDASFSISAQEEQMEEAEELADGLTNVNFFYYHKDEEENAEPPYQWQDSWDYQMNIPKAVKIEVRLAEDEELTFTKLVFIPTGKVEEAEEGQ